MSTDNATWKQWVDLDLEGELEAADKARLDDLLDSDDEARDERRALGSLHRMIDEDQIPVRAGFTARVMEALPRAWWERAETPAGLPKFALPLAMMLIAALGAAMLIGGSEEAGRFTGIGVALFDFMQMTFLAGTGMLFATWRGVGFGLQEMIGTSGTGLAVFALMVLCLNLLFFSMLRRRPRAAAQTAESGQASEGR
ncbi:MAG: hypothetical protein GY719_06985 [bacterium]|nr:hypothetical protein [bacterium]